MDENVHFVHTASVVNALVENNKPYDLQVKLDSCSLLLLSSALLPLCILLLFSFCSFVWFRGVLFLFVDVSAADYAV